MFLYLDTDGDVFKWPSRYEIMKRTEPVHLPHQTNEGVLK